jgi:beta-glucosidase
LAGTGTLVEAPEDADIAIIRLHAPWEHREDLFVEEGFHAGSLDFPPGLVSRLKSLSRKVPLIIDVRLDRPAILTPLIPFASVLVGTFGVSDAALVDALTGRILPCGRLPFELPSSMDEVRASRPDVASDTPSPLFAHGHGLSLIRGTSTA